MKLNRLNTNMIQLLSAITCIGISGWGFSVNADDYSQWSNSFLITMNTSPSGANVPGNVAGFPALVRLTNSNFHFWMAKNDGSDIRFSKPDGTHIPYQIERWDSVDSLAEIWVKTDVAGNDNTQYFIMHCGNSSAADSSNGSAVFNTANGFTGVWHLNELGNSNTGGYADATDNHVDGTGRNMSDADSVTAIIGRGQNFNDTTKYIYVPWGVAPSQVDLANKNMTISAWAKRGTITSGERYIVCQGTAGPGQRFSFGFNPAGRFTLSFYMPNAVIDTMGSSASEWHFWAATFDPLSKTMVLYRDGGQTSTYTSAVNYTTSGDSLLIGRRNDGMYFNGTVDEVNVADSVRSADWIKLCYESQKPGSAWITVSTGSGAINPFGFNGKSMGPRLHFIGTYPEPFGAQVHIRYSVPEYGVSGVTFFIYDLRGNVLWQKTIRGNYGNCTGEIVWNGRSQNRAAASGIYLVRMVALDNHQMQAGVFQKKITLLPY